jgi:hypothetical protein
MESIFLQALLAAMGEEVYNLKDFMTLKTKKIILHNSKQIHLIN